MPEDTKGLFVDLDGTLADSMSVMREVYDAFLEGFGRTGSDREFESLIGPPLPAIVARLRAEHALPQAIEDLITTYNGLLDRVYDEVAPFADAARFLAAGQARGRRTAIVTSNSRARTGRWLEVNGLDGYVSGIVCGDSVSCGKPSPEPYVAALALYGCHAACSIAVEDSPRGAASAVAAGLTTYLVGGRPEDAAAAQGVAGHAVNLEALIPAL